jgi:hypothetical protein
MVEVLATDKNSSFLQKLVKYDRKKVYTMEPWAQL